MHPMLQRIRDVRFHSSLARKALAHYYREGQVYRVPFGPIRMSVDIVGNTLHVMVYAPDRP